MPPGSQSSGSAPHHFPHPTLNQQLAISPIIMQNQGEIQQEAVEVAANQPAEVEMQDQDQIEAQRCKQMEEQEAEELEVCMQAMRLAAQGEVKIEEVSTKEKLQIFDDFNLLMKIAGEQGPSRSVSLNAVRQNMQRAWGKYYYDISEVSDNIFMAHFASVDAIQFVIERQPWNIGKDTILLELVSTDEAKPLSDYRFDSIYITVRFYGVPQNLRSENMLKKLLAQVGQPSDLHPFTDSMLFGQRDYIYGRAIVLVNTKLFDRIKLTGSGGITVYVHYEKINRICFFCGTMFHNANACPSRKSMLWKKQMRGESAAGLPFEILGKWMTQLEKLPADAFQDRDEPCSDLLDKFRKHFVSLALINQDNLEEVGENSNPAAPSRRFLRLKQGENSGSRVAGDTVHRGLKGRTTQQIEVTSRLQHGGQVAHTVNAAVGELGMQVIQQKEGKETATYRVQLDYGVNKEVQQVQQYIQHNQENRGTQETNLWRSTTAINNTPLQKPGKAARISDTMPPQNRGTFFPSSSSPLLKEQYTALHQDTNITSPALRIDQRGLGEDPRREGGSFFSLKRSNSPISHLDAPPPKRLVLPGPEAAPPRSIRGGASPPLPHSHSATASSGSFFSGGARGGSRRPAHGDVGYTSRHCDSGVGAKAGGGRAGARPSRWDVTCGGGRGVLGARPSGAAGAAPIGANSEATAAINGGGDGILGCYNGGKGLEGNLLGSSPGGYASADMPTTVGVDLVHASAEMLPGAASPSANFTQICAGSGEYVAVTYKGNDKETGSSSAKAMAPASKAPRAP